MYQTQTCTSTNTKILTYAKKKAKQSLYLVLKKKSFATEVIEELNEEVEKRLTNFIQRLVKNLEERQCGDPETLLKYTILKAIVKTLDNIMKENYIQMTENDKIAVERIYNGDDDGNDNFKEDRKKNANYNQSQDKTNYNNYGPGPTNIPFGNKF